jgi:methyl-accepting chemotaxis protein
MLFGKPMNLGTKASRIRSQPISAVIMRRTESVMAKIELAIKQVSDMIEEIDRASEQRSEDIEVINRVVTEMDEATQHRAALSWS